MKDQSSWLTVISQQDRGGSGSEESGPEEDPWAGGSAERTSGRPGARASRPHQSRETPPGPRRGAGGAEDRAGGHARLHGCAAGAQVKKHTHHLYMLYFRMKYT